MNKQTAFISCLIISGLIISCGQSKEPTLSERYPGPWIEDFNKDIAIALSQNSIKDCGQYKYRASSSDKKEYLVYCTKDGKKWNSYIVWTGINKIMGPHEPDPSLK